MSKNQLRPLVKKDIFYSGSVQNLQEYKSHGSLDAYRQSNSSIQEYNNNRKFRGEISCKNTLIASIIYFLFKFNLMKFDLSTIRHTCDVEIKKKVLLVKK